MTLVELLLVVALLVVIGSIVVPVFTGGMSSVRLRRAADQVLTRWSQARAKAIETGDVYQFRYTPDSAAFQVEPWSPLEDQEAKKSGPGPARKGSAAASTTSLDSAGVMNSKLPDPIVFHSGQIAVDDPQAGKRQVQSMQSSGNSPSPPLLFFPDGTTSEASVVVGNDRQQYVRLTIRGLTGVARATLVLTQEELDRDSRR